MNTFVQLKEDVAYMNSTGMGVLPQGRIGVLAAPLQRHARSLSVMTIGQGGTVVRLSMPRESAKVLGQCKAPKLAPVDKLYVGEFSGGEHRVTVFPLDKTGELSGQPYALQPPSRHSVGAFDWGYDGDGPADLALALLRDALGMIKTDDAARTAMAEEYYPAFRKAFVERQPAFQRWSTTGSDILSRLHAITLPVLEKTC